MRVGVVFVVIALAATLGGPGGARGEEAPVRFELDREFTLGMGQTARGPGDLAIHYAGLGYEIGGSGLNPGLVVGTGDPSVFPLVAQPWTRREGELVGRALYGDVVITLVRVAPDGDNDVTLVVGRAAPVTTAFTYDVPFLLRPYEFAVGPEGWALALGEAYELDNGAYAVELQHQGRGAVQSEWISFQQTPADPDRAQAGWGVYMFAIEGLERLNTGRDAVRLRIWKPAETERGFTLGEPFTLSPGETGVGPGGLRVKLGGFGHKILLDRSDLPFAHIGVTLGDRQDGARITMEPGRQDAFGSASVLGYSITLLNGDGGPPHRGDVRIRMVVQAE